MGLISDVSIWKTYILTEVNHITSNSATECKGNSVVSEDSHVPFLLHDSDLNLRHVHFDSVCKNNIKLQPELTALATD